jgi:mono/diheme cytochrome c family protein
MTPRTSIAVALLASAALGGCSRATHYGGLYKEGRRVFVTAGCGSCHTVASAHTHGQVGPDFDTSEQLSRSEILTQLNAGGGGMPSFQDTLTPRQKTAVTEFVFRTMHARRSKTR